MHVFSQAFANMLSQKYLGFSSFCKYDFAGIRKLSRNFKFASMVRSASQCFAVFRKLSVFKVSQNFEKFRKVSQIGFLSMHLSQSGG